MKKVHLVSLGCPKNLVDSEVMLGRLRHSGYSVAEDPSDADLLLVNTCGFIRSAVEEAVDEILTLAEFKKSDPEKLLVVTGCLVQRYGNELKKALPEVDLFTGTDGFQEIDLFVSKIQPGQGQKMILREPEFVLNSSVLRELSTPFFRSYLKATEGCNNRCSFCTIPSIRGSLRSRTVDDLVKETLRLELMGVRELTLIAQDLTAYGNDLDKDNDLLKLLQALVTSSNIPWFRLLYLYPSSISEELLAFIASQSKIVPYLDIPIQHFSDNVLKRMNRRYRRHDLDILFKLIRNYLPECAIRTSLMVGFPGENDQDVDEVIDCLNFYQLDHVGVFKYEDEEGTAAINFKDKVDENEKEKRYDKVMKVQALISAEKLKHFTGQIEPVLLEGVSKQSDLLLEGRTRFQAPDIDGCVYITSGNGHPGEIVMVRVIETHTYDLVGEIIDSKTG